MSVCLNKSTRVLISSACVGIAAIYWSEPSAAQAATSTYVADCGPLREVNETSGRMDYRLREVNQVVHDGVNLINHFHTERARRLLSSQADNIANSAIGDIDFTLRHSPNHHEALGLAMEWYRRGGRSTEFPTVDCFFGWAREFAPTDMTVVGLAAQYYWKTGNIQLADQYFKLALQGEPDSAEINYNAGLFYFSRKDYARARKYAQVAYAAGYPLPGLRKMLEREKQWTEN